MKISKKSQYGLRAIIFLAKKYKTKELIPLKDIAKNELIPFDYLEKIFLDLEKSNIVKGKRGRNGGYLLSLSPNKISVLDIMKSLENKINLIECGGCKKINKCVAKNAWQEIEKSFFLTLKNIKLSKLIS